MNLNGDAGSTLDLPAIRIVSHDYEDLIALVGAERAPVAGLALLKRELRRAAIIPAAQAPSDLVRVGSHVALIDLDDHRPRRIRLSSPREAYGRDRVSVTSGLGAAVLGLTPGQAIAWTSASHRRHAIRVLDVAPPTVPRILWTSRQRGGS